MGKTWPKVILFALFLSLSLRADTLPPIQTVFVIVMENYPWSSIKGSSNAPYINNVLLPIGAHCEQYYNPSNYTCSLLSYLWLEAGTAFGISTDDPHCDDPPSVNHQSTKNHLVTLLNKAGISWKTYQEGGLPDQMLLSDSGNYAVRHNAFVYFDDVTGTNNQFYPYGVAHVRPYTELAADLASNNIARYNFITPNLCHDMHNSCAPANNPVRQGDDWLASELPRILASSAYSNNGAIFITWDDPDIPNVVPIGMIVLSPLVRAQGYVSTNRYTHSSTVRTMQEIFRVLPFLGAAAADTNLSELFVPGNTNAPGLARIVNFIVQPGSMQLTVTGLYGGAPLVLEQSSNLLGWTPVSTNFLIGGTPPAATITNSETGSKRQNFYRFRQPVQ